MIFCNSSHDPQLIDRLTFGVQRVPNVKLHLVLPVCIQNLWRIFPNGSKCPNAGYPHPSSVHGFDPAWPGQLHHIISGWWFQTFVIFHHIWDVILPIDELIFFKMVIAPPTRYPSMRMRMSQPFYSHQAWKTGWRVSNHNTRSPPWDWCGKPNNKPCHYVTNHHWRSFYIIPFFGVYPIINQYRLGMVYLSHNLPWLSHYSPISIHILLWISYIPLLLAFPD